MCEGSTIPFLSPQWSVMNKSRALGEMSVEILFQFSNWVAFICYELFIQDFLLLNLSCY